MNNRVLLDPGHGWQEAKGRYGRPLMYLGHHKVHNLGTRGTRDMDQGERFYREDFGTMAIAMAVKKLSAKTDLEIFLTRSPKDPIDAKGHLKKKLNATVWQKATWGRARWIRKAREHWDCDTVVSIHTNAGGGSGVTSFYRNKMTSLVLTTHLTEQVAKHSPLIRRGIKQRRFALLRGAPQGCLIECGFHDDPHDLEVLLDPEGVESIAQGILQGILLSLS